MSVVGLVRLARNLSGRRTFTKFVEIKSQRWYSIQNVSRLCNVTRRCAGADFKNVRYSSSFPTISSVIEPFQWRSYAGSLNQLISQYAESDLVLSATDFMIRFHDSSGLYWWSTIFLSTIAVRTLLIFPFVVHQQHVSSRYELVRDELNTTVDNEITQKVKKLADQNNWDQEKITSEYNREKNERRMALIKEYNCHPMKLAVLVLMQTPIWLTGSCVLRNLTFMQPIADATAQIVHAEMKLNSFLWVHDLTVPDPYFPVLLIVGHMINVRLNVIARRGRRTMIDKLVMILYTSIVILFCNFALEVPSSIVLYWTTSVWCALIQNLIFLSPTARKLFRIPTTKSMRPNAFRKIVNKFKNFYNFLRY